MTAHEAREIAIDIRCPFDKANAFLAVPQNFLEWASGLGSSMQQLGDEWLVETPRGVVRVTFTPLNPFGVLDHRVVTPEGQSILVPLRVIPNGDGCRVMLTLFRLEGMTNDQFTADADWVRRDLVKLKGLLEGA